MEEARGHLAEQNAQGQEVVQENKQLRSKYEHQGEISPCNTNVNPPNATTTPPDLAFSEQDLDFSTPKARGCAELAGSHRA